MNTLKLWSRVLAAGLASLVATGIAFAQRESTSTAVSTTNTQQAWYGEWWYWAIGVGVFLIVVIALTNRPASKA